jgi:hypothetical protein
VTPCTICEVDTAAVQYPFALGSSVFPYLHYPTPVFMAQASSHHHSTLFYNYFPSYAVVLTRQHIITSSVFKLETLSLIQHRSEICGVGRHQLGDWRELDLISDL